MTFDRTRYKSDALHLRLLSIEDKFNDLLHYYEFIEEQINNESARIVKFISEPTYFENNEDENSFYGTYDSELYLFDNEFNQISTKYTFVGLFGLFESSLKTLIINLKFRLECEKIENADEKKAYISKLKNEINDWKLYKLKEYIKNTQAKTKYDNIELFESLNFEITKLTELRNSIIHNHSDVNKKVGKHWGEIDSQITTLAHLINKYYSDSIYISGNTFNIKKNFLNVWKSTYIDYLNESKIIIINYTKDKRIYAR